MSELKDELYQLCKDYVANSSAAIKQRVAEAQDAANNDTKSSAGDKFETGREMMQQEISLDLARLSDILKHNETLERMLHVQKNGRVQPGSLVYTTAGNYYIAIPAGKLSVGGAAFYAVSPAAPIAVKLLGKVEGDEVDMNGKEIRINTIE